MLRGDAELYIMNIHLCDLHKYIYIQISRQLHMNQTIHHNHVSIRTTVSYNIRLQTIGNQFKIEKQI